MNIEQHMREQYGMKERKKKMTVMIIVGTVLVVVGAGFVISALFINEKKVKDDSSLYEAAQIIEIPPEELPEDKKEDPITEWAEKPIDISPEDEFEEAEKEVEEEIEQAELESIIEEGNGEDFDGYLDIPLSHELQVEVFADCEIYDVPIPLVLALMETESSFRSDIGNEEVLGGEEGGARYYGYMQLSIENCLKAEEYGLNAHEPAGNIEMGIKILGSLLLDYDEEWEAVTAYKGGVGYLESCKAKGIIPQTTQNVLAKKAKYEAMIKKGE